MTAQICETCKKKDARCYCAPNSTCSGYEKRTMTRFEKIKLMDVEEMAETINAKTYGCMFRFGCPCDCGDNYPESCVEEIKKWLESEVEE